MPVGGEIWSECQGASLGSRFLVACLTDGAPRNDKRGEFQLTSALDRLRQEGGFQGLTIQGQRYDIGLPDHHVETLQSFRGD